MSFEKNLVYIQWDKGAEQTYPLYTVPSSLTQSFSHTRPQDLLKFHKLRDVAIFRPKMVHSYNSGLYHSKICKEMGFYGIHLGCTVHEHSFLPLKPITFCFSTEKFAVDLWPLYSLQRGFFLLESRLHFTFHLRQYVETVSISWKRKIEVTTKIPPPGETFHSFEVSVLTSTTSRCWIYIHPWHHREKSWKPSDLQGCFFNTLKWYCAKGSWEGSQIWLVFALSIIHIWPLISD